jgi:hypothetical protein
MKPVARDELLDLAAYESIREHFRARVIAEKRHRYVALGERMTLLFENHDTVLFQIQEMLRTERISQEPAIAHEIATYNELIPGDGELSATIFIEYPEAREREQMMVRLAGIEDKFYLSVDGKRAVLVPDSRGTETTRTMAVHYVKFQLGELATKALSRAEVEVLVGVEHPEYRAQTRLSRETLDSLRRDLAG